LLYDVSAVGHGDEQVAVTPVAAHPETTYDQPSNEPSRHPYPDADAEAYLDRDAPGAERSCYQEHAESVVARVCPTVRPDAERDDRA
jgi:hypothetical protein